MVYEERQGVKNLASKFQNSENSLKQESLTSIASESMTSMTSTDTEKGSIQATRTKPILVRKSSGNKTSVNFIEKLGENTRTKSSELLETSH